jgi:hypothetical protein
MSLLPPPSIRRFLVSGLVLGVFATLPLAVHAQAPASPTAPTASEDPVVIDQTWQKASAKYDAPRTTILNDVDRVAHRVRFVRTGNPSRNTRSPSGTRTPSLASSFTGASIPSRLLAASGIRGICIGRVRKSTSTTSPLTARKTSSATRISSPCSKLNASIPRHGRACSRLTNGCKIRGARRCPTSLPSLFRLGGRLAGPLVRDCREIPSRHQLQADDEATRVTSLLISRPS